MRGFFVYLTYKEITKKKCDIGSIIESIKRLPLSDSLIYLSELMFKDHNDINIKGSYLKYLYNKKHLSYEKIAELTRFSVFSHQGLLNLWKYLLAYGEKENLFKSTHLTREDCTNELITLSLKISDHLVNEEKLKDKDSRSVIYELMSNGYFNTNKDVSAAIGRSALIYNDITQNQDNFHPSDFIDIHTDFKKHYGYSIRDYFACITALCSKYINKETLSDDLITSLEYFQTTILKDIAPIILQPMMFDFDEGKEWAIEAISKPWDFSLFQRKPFFTINGTQFVPVYNRYLEDKLFESLYYHIRQAYPSDDTSFSSFYGKPFELYIQLLLEECIKQSKLPYTLIKEFKFGKNADKSPDAMVRLNSKLLIFEAKTRKAKNGSIIDSQEESIQNDLNSMVKGPILQAQKAILKILNTEHQYKENFIGIEEIYIITVVPRRLPYFEPIKTELREEINSEINSIIKGYYDFDIEELEMLGNLLAKRKKPIFPILSDYNISNQNSFKNFLYYRNFTMSRPDFINNRTMVAFDEIMKHLGYVKQDELKNLKTHQIKKLKSLRKRNRR
ncbi:hypothetical protein IMZ08_19295 [Bacillus luteolus]|uniref:NERD domain-containing protein n=1 Tax=Litchfieldia luteola TaxID=682179 RepID=A0ABR9QNW3_9BACI|nr:hypothetical protein [Cytobacillus luteolus]MBE4910187.1 hypothetical protein [Cytobacillus luteolus]MBP1942244.1 hypothetical protein [Cytobacillus luteolus]